MNAKSKEIVKQLNRLVNDRSLPLQARNKVNQAAQHIREMQLRLAKTKGMSEGSNS